MVTHGTEVAVPPRPEMPEAPVPKKRRPPTWLVIVAGLFVLGVIASMVNPSPGTSTSGGGTVAATSCVDMGAARGYNDDAVSELHSGTTDLQGLRFADAADHLMNASRDYANIADEFAAYPAVASLAQSAADDMETGATLLASASITEATQYMYKAKTHIVDFGDAVDSASVNEC